MQALRCMNAGVGCSLSSSWGSCFPMSGWLALHQHGACWRLVWYERASHQDHIDSQDANGSRPAQGLLQPGVDKVVAHDAPAAGERQHLQQQTHHVNLLLQMVLLQFRVDTMVAHYVPAAGERQHLQQHMHAMEPLMHND